jgi:hypothetical protein
MTLYQFNLLDQTERAEILWDKGVHLANRQEKDFKILLYQVDGFYVEVWYDVNRNEISRLKSLPPK